MDERKSMIRKEVLEKRLSLSEKEVREKSLLIKERLFGLKEFKDSKLVMFYAGFKNEVRTQEMMEEALSMGKKIALPVTSREGIIKPYLVFNLDKDLMPGRFGILEPETKQDREVSPKDIDVILVPGAAFDKKGGRIGFGKGCYDRLLKNIESFSIGLAFEMQIIESIPLMDYDENVNIVITERQIYAGV